MNEFHSVYRFKDDFILLATFTSKADADDYYAAQVTKGTTDLYSKVVTQSVGSLVVTLSPFRHHDGAEYLVELINKAAA